MLVRVGERGCFNYTNNIIISFSFCRYRYCVVSRIGVIISYFENDIFAHWVQAVDKTRSYTAGRVWNLVRESHATVLVTDLKAQLPRGISCYHELTPAIKVGDINRDYARTIPHNSINIL